MLFLSCAAVPVAGLMCHTAFDRLLAARFRVTAVERLMAGEHGVMVGLQGRKINTIALAEVCANKRRANLEYYRMARMLAK